MTATNAMPGAQTNCIRTVAVIGAGVLGRELAARAVLAGFRVVLEDVLPANLRNAKAKIDPLLKDAAQIDYVLTVEDAVREADLAIDFVPDELESKLEIFCLIDRMAPPKTIICTPAVQVGIADIASCTYRAPRCMAVRPAIEGERLPGTVVRLMRTPATTEDVAEAVKDFWIAIGCIVVAVDVDIAMPPSGIVSHHKD
jgi:3-hydroxybutyryl-CoA dehydrogenase